MCARQAGWIPSGSSGGLLSKEVRARFGLSPAFGVGRTGAVQDSGRPERRSAERRSETRRDPKSGRRTNCVRDGSQPVNVDLSVTVSIGVAEPTAKTRTVEEVIQAADKALYRAKQTGRNRVERSTAVARRARSRRNIA